MTPPKQGRPSDPVLVERVTIMVKKAEKKEIIKAAGKCGQSVSAYGRNKLGYTNDAHLARESALAARKDGTK